VRLIPGSVDLWEVLDRDSQRLAVAAMTSPQSDSIVGYAGPNNVLLLLDDAQTVQSAHLLGSSDTRDHVSRVQHDAAFWQQFVGASLGENQTARVDGVSGATLTSLAIAEAIHHRLSGQRLSLRFPEELTIDEAQLFFSEAHSLQADRERLGWTRVLDATQGNLGWLLRTGPVADSVVGYQGPTELMVALDPEETIIKIRVRRSFDNEPYVRYTKQEASFWAKFTGRSLLQVSQLDFAAEGIEGVSGATMTSMAAAETLRLAAQRYSTSESGTAAQVPQPVGLSANWSWGELSTAVLALAMIPWSLSRWRGQRRWRWVWQSLCLLVIVGLSGNLISLALLAGWARSGPAWKLAPGLALMVSLALIAPILLGRNVYCDHVCPHGIAQQWLARCGRRYWPGWLVSGNRWWNWCATASAGIILLLCVGWFFAPDQVPLAWLEPFDVYAWRVGLGGSCIVWVISILWSSRQPMAYCRLACPTGKVLDTLRAKRTGRRPVVGDILLGLAIASVWMVVWLNVGE